MNQHGCFEKWTLVKSIFSTMDFLLLLFALVFYIMFYIMAVNVYNSIICLLYTILTNYKL